MSTEISRPAAAQMPLADIERAAHYAAKSGLFGVKSLDQAVALMLVAQAEGLHPMRAVQEYHVIQGRPALRADAILARFQQAGGRVQWHAVTDRRCDATFTHPAGGSVRIDWDMDRARRAGLAGRDSWKQYPRAMLRARVISEGVRAVYPGVCVGVYTPEEVIDMPSVEVVTPPPQIDEAQTEPAGGEPQPAATEQPATARDPGQIAGWIVGRLRAAPDEAAIEALLSTPRVAEALEWLALEAPEQLGRVESARDARLAELGHADAADTDPPF